MTIRDRDGIITLGDDDANLQNNITIKANNTPNGGVDFYTGTPDNLGNKLFSINQDGETKTKYTTNQSVNATATVGVQSDTFVTLTLNSASCDVSVVADENFSEANSVRGVVILLIQGTGSNSVTWPANVKWANGVSPNLSFTQNEIDIVRLITIDNGTTWLGSFEGSWG